MYYSTLRYITVLDSYLRLLGYLYYNSLDELEINNTMVYSKPTSQVKWGPENPISPMIIGMS